MSQLIYLYLITLYFVVHIEECLCHYIDIYTNNRMRFMMYAMDRELIKDAIQKIESCQFMKAFYSKSPSFHVAQRIFNIRRKFARMMRLYVIAHDTLTKGLMELKPSFFQTTMIDMQKISMDIDHLVEVLTEWEENGAKKVINIGGFNLPSDLSATGMENFADMGFLPSMPPLPGMPPPGKSPPGMPPAGSIHGAPGGGPGGAPGPDGVPGLGGTPGPGGVPGPGGEPGPGVAPGPGGGRSGGGSKFGGSKPGGLPRSGGAPWPSGKWRPRGPRGPGGGPRTGGAPGPSGGRSGGGSKSGGNTPGSRPRPGGVPWPAGEWRPRGVVGAKGAFGWF